MGCTGRKEHINHPVSIARRLAAAFDFAKLKSSYILYDKMPFRTARREIVLIGNKLAVCANLQPVYVVAV